IGVSGIGPKMAVGILSGISPRNFRAAVRQGNAPMLSVVPGIGKKKAERLIVELKDKIGAIEIEGRSGRRRRRTGRGTTRRWPSSPSAIRRPRRRGPSTRP
ncbi:MAG: helix-hairpin-helix domain-containing protein, partial [Planctomycetota bacterium]